MTDSVTPRTAPAAEYPCQLRRYHAPEVVRTQHHHSRPQYLQLRIYGAVRHRADMWLCPNDHDAIHAWLAWLLGEARRPAPEPGWLVKAEAQRTYDWYQQALIETG